jgi:hypothetical protein
MLGLTETAEESVGQQLAHVTPAVGAALKVSTDSKRRGLVELAQTICA